MYLNALELFTVALGCRNSSVYWLKFRHKNARSCTQEEIQV